MTLDTVSEVVATLYTFTNAQLREVIYQEREQGRAWGTVAEAARTLLALRTGRAS